MDVKKAIESRRSIRRYLDKKIPDEAITELLEAARLAPSAKNVQSHKYYVVKAADAKERLKSHNAIKQPFPYAAPLIIVCCADPTLYPESVDVDDHPENYAIIDLTIATAFMTLRATELGIGSVYIAWIYRDAVKQALKIPEKYIIPYVIAFGYPAEAPAAKPRKALKEITF